MDGKVEEKTRRKKTKRRYPLPRADITLDKEINILKALVTDTEKGTVPLKYNELDSVSTNKYTISTELNFFASIGLAIREKNAKYRPTNESIEIAENIMWDRLDEGKKILKKVLLKSWFGEKVVKLLRIEKEKNVKELMKLLGKEVGGLPERDEKAISRLIEWLEYAEIIEIDENEIVHLKEVPKSKNVEEKSHPEEKIESVSKTIMEKEMVKSEEPKKVQRGFLLSLTINLQIDSNTDVEKIREIIRLIKQDLVEDIY